MNQSNKLCLMIAALTTIVVPVPQMLAVAGSPIPPSSSLGRPSTLVTGSGEYSATAMAMVKSRARALGNAASGSGTRYFSVTDTDLVKLKSSSAIVRRLSPAPITARERVRRVEIAVEIQRPLYLRVPAGTSVRVGTAVVDPNIRNIEVTASIYVRKVVVVGGRGQAKELSK